MTNDPIRTGMLGLAVVATAWTTAGCDVGAVTPPGDEGTAQWTPITDGAAGLVQGSSFELDPAGNIVAIVNNKVCQWDDGSGTWTPLADPPPNVRIEHIRLRNGVLFAMLSTPNGRQVCQYNAGAWQPRTLIGPSYAGGFGVHGSDNRITAVITAATGRQLCECDLAGCTPQTPIAEISSSDFDCNGCGAGGATFFAQLGTKVCSATPGAAQWTPQTVDAPAALGPSVIAESGEIFVEIGDHICQYDADAQAFVDLTAAFPNMIDFKRGAGTRADSWLGLAGGVVCEYPL